jgi:hypothetical protein
MQAIENISEIESGEELALDIPILIEEGLERSRMEDSLKILESMQSQFRRGREVLAPYFDSAYAALTRMEQEEDREQILETCEALERVMRMWEKSRACLENVTSS